MMIGWFSFVFFWLFFSVAAGMFADMHRNRHPAWFLVGVFFTPIVAWVLLLILPALPPRQPGKVKGLGTATIVVGVFVAVFGGLAVLGYVSAAHAAGTTQRDAPTTRFYDSRGNVTGSASTYGNQTRFYDARGNHTGTAIHHNGR
jgi:hypothetical protein